MVTMYFLNDFAEFGRKVKLKKGYIPHGSNQVQSTTIPSAIRGSWNNAYGGEHSGTRITISDTKANQAYINRGLKGDNDTIKLPARTHVIGDRSRQYYKNFDTKLDSARGTDLEWVKRGKPVKLTETRKVDRNKKSLKSPKRTPTSSTVKPKSSPKLINKYALGAAGVLGTGLAGLGAYKLLTRKKKEK